MKKTEDKVKTFLGVIVLTLVISGVFFYKINISSINPVETATIFIVLILASGAGYMLWRKIKAYKKSLPLEDEFIKKVNYKAGYYAFIAAIGTSLIVGMMEDSLISMGLSIRHGGYLVLLVTGFVFSVSYIYLSKWGSAD